MGELRVTRTNLSDGRELLYFDELGTPNEPPAIFATCRACKLSHGCAEIL